MVENLLLTMVPHREGRSRRSQDTTPTVYPTYFVELIQMLADVAPIWDFPRWLNFHNEESALNERASERTL